MKQGSKRRFRRVLAMALVFTMLLGMPGLAALAAETDTTGQGSSTPELRLWYNQPTSQTSRRGATGSGVPTDDDDYWQKNTLPIGNGDLGANVYGEIGTERLTLNEKTLWTGGPSESRQNYIGGNLENKGRNGAQLKTVQQYFLAGNTTAAVNAAGQLVGEDNGNYGYYTPWGELNIATSGLTNTSTVTGYERWLTLDDALAGVRFTSGGTTYTREYLMSNPDNVLAVKLTASKNATFTITLPGKMNGSVTTATAVGNDTLKLCGHLTDNQEKYASFLKAVPGEGTTVTGSGSSLTVTGTEVTLFFSAATDYKAIYPTYRNGETDAELAARVKVVVDAAASKGYDAVKADHLSDYHSLYNRVSVDVGQTSTTKPTDELIVAYKNGTATAGEERLLEIMIFQYGRYLTIAASRENSILPTNLQGVWNNRNNPPWMSDYHTNVNLQMNYWPTYSTNLAECADSLIRFVESLREPGRVTARVYAGIESTVENPENGFMAHTQTTPYGYTTPGWSFDWGWSPAAIAWLIQNCWEYYEYTGDLNYMRNNIYPIMREYCRFYDQFLIDTTTGKTADKITGADTNVVLASVPAYSPETGPRTMGNTYEHSIIWQLYEDTMTAAKLLNVDSDRIGDENTPGTWLYNQSHLQGPIEIGASGQIKEWFHEVEFNKDANGNALGEGYGHRHLSHMLGLYPGDLIQTNEEWVEAARVSMNNRNDVNTGWSMTHRANVWARLRDGNHAHKVLGLMIKNDKFYNNLWDTHAPFQIDGNFGYTAGVSEMLLQSNMGFIDLLPALPDAWASGSYSGLVARGNFEISAVWADSSLTGATIVSKNGGECVVRYPNLSRAVVKDSNDNIIEFEVLADDKVSFPSAKGATYTITEIPAQDISVVEDAVAYRATDDTTELFWTAKEGETYQVYRQIAGGDILPVGDTVTEGHFVDETAYMELGQMNYFIAVNEAGPSEAIPLVDMRNQMFDDKDSRIVYTGGWGTWNDSACYAGGIHFIESINTTTPETLEFTFYGTGIEVRGCTNTGWGTMTAAIDGSGSEVVNFRDSRAHTVPIYTKNDLERGVHTIKLTGVSGKIEFDAFKVLDSGDAPADITVSSGGITRLAEVGATVQMTASDPNVTWSVECASGVASISTSGLLTAGSTAGTVKVVATSKANATIKGECTLTVSLPEVQEIDIPAYGTSANNSTNVNDNNLTEANRRITYSPNNTWYLWNEGTGQLKAEVRGDAEGTKYFTYAFNVPQGKVGTLEIYAQTMDQDSGNITYTLDGANDITYNLLSSKAWNVKVASYEDIAAGDHTLKGTPAAVKVNLIALKLILTTPVPDRSALRNLIQECAALDGDSYTAESWADLQTALTSALGVVNAESVTENQLTEQVNALTNARDSLASKSLDTAPTGLEVILTEGTAVTLKWEAVTGATGYEVTVDGETYETTATTYRVTGLDSGEEYSFTVKAVNDGGESPASDAVTATTLDTVAPDKPTNLAWNESTNTLTWNAATDNVGVTEYKVLVNGTQQGGAETGTSKVLTLSGTQNTVTVIAVDAAGNESIPAKLVVAPTYQVATTNATIQGGKTRFKVGEAVTVTADVPETGSILTGWTVTGVTLNDDDKTAETVTFSMPAGNVSLIANVEEKNWNVTAELTNLYSDLTTGKTVPHGEELTVRLTTSVPYKLPTSVQVVMGGQQLQSPWVTYSVTDGVITVREVTGDVVITAENAPQTPTGTTFTEADPFQLPTNVGDSTKLEAEYMELAKGSGSSLAAVYGPNFGNKQLTGFVNGDTIKLYYNAEYPGTYTLTLRYSSNQTADTPHKFNWSGENVEEQINSVESTLDDSGTAVYSTTELEFTVTEEGPGMVTFTTAAPGGPDIDSITFTLDEIDATYVEEITLDQTEVTLYLSGDTGEDTTQLSATVTPDEAGNKELRWSSSDSSVAYVTQDGVVGARSNGTTTITATAMDGSNVTATATVTVKTRITGVVTISGVPQYGQNLVASVNQISNQSAQDTLTYQWNRDGETIEGATDRHYTVTKDDIDCELTVTVFATDPYVGAEGGTTSDPVTATPADGPDVTDTLDAVDFTDTENGKITGLDATTAYEYKLVSGGEDDWVEIPANSTEFEVPAPGSYHVRVAASEDGTTAAGAPSSTLTILAADATGNAINIGTFTGGVVRADVNKANEGDTVTLTVLPKTGYQFVDGSLKVNDGDVTVNEDGTFAMPDGVATVTAEFELKTYTITHSLTNVTCSEEENDHQVTHGDKPTITIYAVEGYDLPHVITMTMTEGGAPFTDYEYDYDYNDDTVTGLIVFTNGIPGDLTITGAGIKKSLPVIYALYGLSSADGARSVEYHDELTFTITPKNSYTLPDAISITMDGEAFTDFTYTVADDVATVTIAAGKITGELAITAEGTSDLPPLALVEIEGTVMVGRQLRAVPTPSNVFPDYRWLRVDSDGNEYPIYGATNRTYVITTDDEGYAIKVAATGAGVKFGNTIYSEPTEVVESANVVATTGVTLNKTTATITVGGNALQLTATVQPTNASNKAVTWKSSDESVVFVTSNGAVFGRGLGTATVTVTTVNGSKTATCTVTVVAVSLPATASVTVGGTTTIKVTVPEDLSNKTLTWSSSDEEVATVDENGVVTGVKAGTATITVETGDGYTADCTVTVRIPSSSSSSSTSTKTETREDGSKVTTITKSDGTVTETVAQPDGTKSETVTTPEGDTTITVTDPEGEELAKVEIPAEIPAPETQFEDIDQTPWAEEAINNVAGLKLVNGIGGNKYDPTTPMTRGSLATVLHRLSQGKTDYKVTFKDVAANRYYTEGVAWAAKAKVVTGYTTEIFAPDDIITREQLAVMMVRYAKLIGMDTTAKAESLDKFTDGENTGAWAVDGVAWCVENGILKGKGQNNLDPTANVSRAEVAVMLDRFINLIK